MYDATENNQVVDMILIDLDLDEKFKVRNLVNMA
jgi:hypothetical protein